MSKIKSWLDAGLRLFYPEVCQQCGNERATPAEGYIGAQCSKHVQFIVQPYCERCGLPFEGEITTAFECSNCRDMEHAFSHARSAVAARGVVLDIIHRYKYQRALWAEPFLAGLLVRAAAPVVRAGRWDMIVPVPLHPLKKAEREFNQSERLGRHLSRTAGIPMETRRLVRLVPTRTQTTLSREERADNVRNAFRLRESEGLQGRRVVLIDDVFTTGATTGACARVLREAGAAEVCVWTLARGLMR